MSLPASQPWHALPAADVATILATDVERGLSAADAEERLARHGHNTLPTTAAPTRLAILRRQLTSLVIGVLVAAAVVSIAVGEWIDGIAILAIVAIDAAVGYLQELRAEQAMAAMARLTAPRARVLRDGGAVELAADLVVPGDVLLLDAGDLVAADARVVDAAVLGTIEAPLTGESEPTTKRALAVSADAPLAERSAMVFLGTSVASGTGRAVVVATGLATELGRIATLLDTAGHGQTPLQRELDTVGRRLLWASLAIVLTVVALGLARGTDPFELFLAAISLAVAAIPEGLPAVVTIALAVGVQRMARRHALVRRLPAVETLGAAQVICTDKTGTLTVGAMTARRIVTAADRFDVTGEGFATDGAITDAGGTPVVPAAHPALAGLLVAAAGCADAQLTTRDGRPAVVGDPTEGALLVLAAKGGVARDTLDRSMPRLGIVPFDADRRRMTVVRDDGGTPHALVKGAPEVILARCTHVHGPDGTMPLDDDGRARLAAAAEGLAARALRVLAFADRRLPIWPAAEDDVEQGLAFLGLVGLQDPPRPDVRDAIARCRRAGVRPVMITGDHPATARAIGVELGLLGPDEQVCTGHDLDTLDDEALRATVVRTAAYARVTAEHKLRIVRAWQACGSVVAMTGDGVNDAPALREADIGIAMGIAGTEVTKAAADMILTDDHFATIVAAVEEGRGIYDNIAKTLVYLVAGNSAELITMLVAAVLGWPLPLLPIHLLWINLVTDGLPALALATEPIAPDVLDRPPRPRAATLADGRFFARALGVGLLAAGVTLVAFASTLATTGDATAARTAAFTVLVFEELLRAFAVRSPTRTIAQMGLFSNPRLTIVVVAGIVLQIALLHVPVLATVFDTIPATPGDLACWIALAVIPLTALEIGKLVARRSSTEVAA